MKKIDIPNIPQSEVFAEFDNLNTNKLKPYIKILEDNSLKYRDYLDNLILLYDSEVLNIKRDYLYKEDLNDMYSNRFSKKGYANLYRYYSLIRNSVGHCPYCNFPSRSISELDHYLPKAIFPSLSVTVTNLVPICMDCNKNKLGHYSLIKDEMLIHPYYDEFVNEAFEYIGCDIIEEIPIGFIFYIKKLNSWDSTMFNRMQLHFEKIQLQRLYSSDFDSDFSSYFEELKELYEDFGEKGVKEAINRKLRSLKKSKGKAWHYAGYKSIVENLWFFDNYIKYG